MRDDGHIEYFDSEEKAKEPGYKTMLTPKEYQALQDTPEQDRPIELALHRFWVELKAPFDIAIKNAFRCGYRAALNAAENIPEMTKKDTE